MISDADYFMIVPSEEPLDLPSVFGNSNPVYIEIGSGKGEFISGYPVFHPDWNFIGFEVRGKRIRNCLKKLDPVVNPNVRLAEVKVDANISKILLPESISGAYIQHPDPWPKKRHFRRRLIQQDLLNSLATILKPGALLQVSTDHQEYANWIVEEFLANPFFESIYDNPMQEQPILDEHIVTWFEREQKQLGYSPYYMMYKRV
ncbi:MAG TPA: tRNA (guanosine(46)-N7)-methyltransferase TrmB [Candidatus Cloacimonadota bacterium]|nr:tRNA (guanosine(46)-N7)-methyltransferase TrmB [Candidatus Cloacimonadota bacterium]